MKRHTSCPPSRLLTAAMLVATLVLSSGCVLEWVEWVTSLQGLNTAADEHRIKDLRVLAIEADPPELRYRPALFEADTPPIEPLRLHLEAFAFDPRGGQIETSLQLCPTEASDQLFFNLDHDFTGCATDAELAMIPADARVALAPIARVVRADPTLPAGRVPGLVYDLLITPAAVRELLARGGETAPTSTGVNVQVVLRVSREFAGQRETEWAVLPVLLRADLFTPGVDDDVVQRVLDEENLLLCNAEDPLRECIDPAWLPPPFDAPSTCGDGAVTGSEQCDPPDGLLCDDGCMLMNVCERSCLWRSDVNARPEVLGFDLDVFAADAPPPRFSAVADADVAVGGTVTLGLGQSIGLGAVLSEASSQQYSSAVSFGEPGPFRDPGDGDERPPDAPDDAPVPEPEPTEPRSGALFTESIATSWYILGTGGRLLAPVEFDGSYYSQGWTGAIEYLPAPDRLPGTREPILLIANDGRGGMDAAIVELVIE